MQEIYQEYSDSSPSIGVAAEDGLLRGVKILGLTSRNGRRYPADVLQKAASLYEGAKVNVNHAQPDNPTCPRDYRDRIGSITNIVYRENTGLFADFHFNPNHPQAKQLLWDAEHAPSNVGFSHCVEAIVHKESEQIVVDDIVRVISVDLVADPATTSGLFESQENEEAKNPDETRVFVPENAVCESSLNENQTNCNSDHTSEFVDSADSVCEQSEEKHTKIEPEILLAENRNLCTGLQSSLTEIQQMLQQLSELINKRLTVETITPVCPPSAWQQTSQEIRPIETIEDFIKSVKN